MRRMKILEVGGELYEGMFADEEQLTVVQELGWRIAILGMIQTASFSTPTAAEVSHSCACDIPSHAYTYSFALNPDWPRFFSFSGDIWKYLDKVCNTFDLRKYMTFNTEVVGCYWDEEKGEWKVKLRETKPGQEPREFEDHCHLLLHGTGILNNFKVRVEGVVMSLRQACG